MKRKGQIDIINILKYAMVMVFMIYIVWLHTMQGGTRTPIKTMKKQVLASMDVAHTKKGTTQDLKRYYGLNADDYKGIVFFIPNDVMGVDELLLVKLSTVGQAEQVEAAAQKRLETQKSSFEGYGVEQTKLISNAVIESKGDYVLLVIHKDADAVQRAFRKSL